MLVDALSAIGRCGLLPVAIINNSANATDTARAILAGGISAIEVTLRTDSAIESISRISKEVPDIMVGAGTVLSVDNCIKAVEAGAKFIVAPGFNKDLVEWCIENNVPVVPGVTSPTEIEKALSCGLKVLKFFPANVYGGSKGCAALYGPYKSAGIKFIPTGGVNNENLSEYIGKPYIHAVGGSWMCKAADIDAGNFEEIRAQTAAAVKAALGFEFAHLGIYFDEENEAQLSASILKRTFGFAEKQGRSSVFSSDKLELCKSRGLGRNGHVAVKTNSITLALEYLKRQGFSANAESAKYRGEVLTSIYLDLEIGGFSVHLLQK